MVVSHCRMIVSAVVISHCRTTVAVRYLKLKAALTPYHYTLSRAAYDTGVPPVRAMVRMCSFRPFGTVFLR